MCVLNIDNLVKKIKKMVSDLVIEGFITLAITRVQTRCLG